MSCSRRRAALALGLVALAGACGFRPLYAPGAPAAAARGRIAVDPVGGAAGFALRERLVERLGPADAPSHRLATELDIRRDGAAITRDNVTTRYTMRGVAAFALVPVGGAEPVLAGEVRAETGFSTPAGGAASAFAARAAEEDATERLARALADRIVLRLAVAAGELAA